MYYMRIAISRENFILHSYPIWGCGANVNFYP